MSKDFYTVKDLKAFLETVSDDTPLFASGPDGNGYDPVTGNPKIMRLKPDPDFPNADDYGASFQEGGGVGSKKALVVDITRH